MPKIAGLRRPSARGSETRRRIESAAVALVVERGWDAATTRAVAARAGVNPALIHYHFDSIDTLLRGAVVAALESSMTAAARPLEAESFAEALGGAIAAIERFEPGSPVAILLAEALVRASRDPALAEPIVGSLRAFRVLVSDRLARAAEAGDAPADLPPGAFGALVAALLDGLLLHRVLDPTTDIAGARDLLFRLALSPTAQPGDTS